MRAEDVPAVLAIQAQAYAGFEVLEDAALFHNRLQLSPATCWVARIDGAMVGYLVSYPWTRDMPPPLNQCVAHLPDGADSWFLHDCAVGGAAAGLGVGRQLVTTALQSAARQGWRHATLVSLAPAVHFWRRQGYRPRTIAAADRALLDKLQGYGEGACYMARAL